MAVVAGHDQGPAHLSVELEVEFCGQRTMTDRNGSEPARHGECLEFCLEPEGPARTSASKVCLLVGSSQRDFGKK